MEVSDDDRRIGNDVLRDHIAPFPDTSFDLFYHYQQSNLTALPSSEEAEVIAPPLSETLPPQKLRPIRCSARSPPLAGDVLSFDDAGLGFLSSGGCTVGSGAFLPVAACSGHSSVPEDMTRNIKMGSSSKDESSCSDDGNESLVKAAVRRTSSKKRGRSRKRLELSIENMVMKVMERQELMYKQLVETIEKREIERISREEAWHQQQMERSKQKEKLITQDITRNAAIIELVEKLSRQETPEQVEPMNSCRPWMRTRLQTCYR